MEKEPTILISSNVLQELKQATEKAPLFATDKGSVYTAKSIPFAAVRLTVTTQEYLSFIRTIPDEFKLSGLEIVPSSSPEFDFIIMGILKMGNSGLMLNDKPIVIL